MPTYWKGLHTLFNDVIEKYIMTWKIAPNIYLSVKSILQNSTWKKRCYFWSIYLYILEKGCKKTHWNERHGMVYKQIHLSACRHILLILSSVLWTESKALHLLGKHSTKWAKSFTSLSTSPQGPLHFSSPLFNKAAWKRSSGVCSMNDVSCW